MASQVPQSSDSLSVAEIDSFIRGYHVSKDDWTPFTGEHLLLRREPENAKDKSAVAVIKDGEVVASNMSNTVSQFLRRNFKKEMTGSYVNRGAGYGLEVYRFYGPEPYIRKLQEFLSSLRAAGLI